MNRKRSFVLLALLAIALPATGLAMQSTGDVPIYHTVAHSAAFTYDFAGTIVKLDTATGAIYELRGNVDSTPATGFWSIKVPAVGRVATGTYELQRPRGETLDAVFLVDRVTGASWLLRWNDTRNGSWFRLDER